MSEGVALGVFGNSVVALTRGKPEIATGVDPRGMAMTRPDTLLSCVAKRGVVDMGHVVLYPSTDGLVAISAGEPRVITETLMKREDWQALNPASMHAYRYKGSYLCFYDTGTKQGALLVDPSGAGLTFVDLYATAGWVEPQGEGALYLVIDHTVVRFDAGQSVRDSRWRSKLWVFLRPANLVVGKLEAEAYPVRLRVWLDGVLCMDRDVSQRQFNLPAPSRGERVQLEVSGSNRVRSVALAESIEELRQL
jgi:hypothetical protein